MRPRLLSAPVNLLAGDRCASRPATCCAIQEALAGNKCLRGSVSPIGNNTSGNNKDSYGFPPSGRRRLTAPSSGPSTGGRNSSSRRHRRVRVEEEEEEEEEAEPMEHTQIGHLLEACRRARRSQTATSLHGHLLATSRLDAKSYLSLTDLIECPFRCCSQQVGQSNRTRPARGHSTGCPERTGEAAGEQVAF